MTALLLLFVAAVVLLVAAVGVARLPDPFQRMHSATKAGTLGAVGAVAAAAVAGGAPALPVAATIIVALFLTIPAAAQILGRALYTSGALLRLGRPDPLAGKLPRASGPEEERAAPGTTEAPDAS